MTDTRAAIYPGSFDPLTLGHEDIAERCLRLADRLIIAVAHTATQEKNRLFSVEERVEMISERFKDEPRIEVTEFSGLLVDFTRSQGARLVVRGLRAVSDFEYEFQMALTNRKLAGDIETIFLMPAESFAYVSATLLKEAGAFGADLTAFVPPFVATALRRKLAG